MQWEEPHPQATYPGMTPTEAAIWTRWLAKHNGQVVGVSYNVRLGQGLPVPDGIEDWLKRDWQALTQLRADVLANWNAQFWVVEVKPRQAMSGLGQCLCYAAAARRQFQLAGTPRMLHVVSAPTPDLVEAFERAGVICEVV